MTQNPFQNRSSALEGPALDIVPITPDDAATLARFPVALHIETGGTIAFETIAKQVRTVVVPDHFVLPVGTRRVLATGTTASGIHGYLV